MFTIHPRLVNVQLTEGKDADIILWWIYFRNRSVTSESETINTTRTLIISQMWIPSVVRLCEHIITSVMIFVLTVNAASSLEEQQPLSYLLFLLRQIRFIQQLTALAEQSLPTVSSGKWGPGDGNTEEQDLRLGAREAFYFFMKDVIYGRDRLDSWSQSPNTEPSRRSTWEKVILLFWNQVKNHELKTLIKRVCVCVSGYVSSTDVPLMRAHMCAHRTGDPYN